MTSAMPGTDANLAAYRQTRDTVIGEYLLRLGLTAGVAAIAFMLDPGPSAIVWWIAMAGFLGLEAALYRNFFNGAPTLVPVSVAARLAAVSFSGAVVYAWPAFAFLADGAPSSYFAAAAFLAGTLIHLVVHNSATRLIFAASATPIALAFLAIGIDASLDAASMLPLLTVGLFVYATLMAYLAKEQGVRRTAEAMREALQARETAERASAAKSIFLAKMSHELRTPLNGVLGMAEALKETPRGAEDLARIDAIIACGRALEDMLADTLDATKIEAGRLDLDPRPADIAAIARETEALFRPAAAEKGLALNYDLSALAEPRAVVDAGRLRQALIHLVSNAVKFTDSGAVLVKARSARGADGNIEAVIEVSDTGRGLAPEDAARVFEPFEQADNSTTRRDGGAGLGLALARGVAEAMGGALDLATRPGAGSTFSFRFSAAPAPPAPAAPAAVSIEGVRVLLVEDNPVNREVVKALLRPLKVKIVEAENGAEALVRLRERAFDVVLMDLHMPVMDGLAAMRAIRAGDPAYSRTPVVALTAAVSAEDRAASFAAGADAFLAKPVRRDLLAGVIARFAVARASELLCDPGDAPPASLAATG